MTHRDNNNHRQNERRRDWRSSAKPLFGLAVVFGLMLQGCWEKTPRNFLEPISEAGRISKSMWDLLLAVNIGISIVVAIIFFYAIWRFRERPDDDGSLPEQVHGNVKMEIGWTILPTIIVIAITIPTLQGIFALEAGPAAGEEVVDIRVIGKQWWWEYDYTDAEGNTQFTTANEMHIPKDTWIRLQVTSADVIHAWWVPRLMGKRDATPGRSYPVHFKAEEVGVYEGQCAELCGESHALMGIKLFVHPKEGVDSYAEWLKAEQAPAKEPISRQEDLGKRLFLERGCNACHNIRGYPEAQINSLARSRSTGPDLTHVGSRTTIGALTMANTKDNLAHWIYDPLSIKGGALMVTMSAGIYEEKNRLTEDEAEAIAAYLYRLK